jgi:hypothetical protein
MREAGAAEHKVAGRRWVWVSEAQSQISETEPYARGTGSSNPTSSSGESANFRFLSRPLRGPPIAVGGGVVLAASYEAKAFGVRSGMPGRRACELCPERTFVSGHFEDYQRLGDAAIKVLGDYTPLVERISIDEAFAMSRIDA